MKKARQKLLEAHRTAREAEHRFKSTLSTAKVEFRPANIAGNALQNAKDKVGEAVTKTRRAVTSRPVTVLAAGAAIGLYLFRKPIASAVRNRISRRRKTVEPVRPLDTQRTNNGPSPIKDPTPKTILTEEV
ncbi:MAG: hypothetical protein AAGE05_00760 [Pseudomonadota bacterium]